MPNFEHKRHKPPRELVRPRELVVVCAPMRSNINLSRIARPAACCGLTRMICCGPARSTAKLPAMQPIRSDRRPSHVTAGIESFATKDTTRRPGANEQLPGPAPLSISNVGRR